MENSTECGNDISIWLGSIYTNTQNIVDSIYPFPISWNVVHVVMRWFLIKDISHEILKRIYGSKKIKGSSAVESLQNMLWITTCDVSIYYIIWMLSMLKVSKVHRYTQCKRRTPSNINSVELIWSSKLSKYAESKHVLHSWKANFIECFDKNQLFYWSVLIASVWSVHTVNRSHQSTSIFKVRLNRKK